MCVCVLRRGLVSHCPAPASQPHPPALVPPLSPAPLSPCPAPSAPPLRPLPRPSAWPGCHHAVERGSGIPVPPGWGPLNQPWARVPPPPSTPGSPLTQGPHAPHSSPGVPPSPHHDYPGLERKGAVYLGGLGGLGGGVVALPARWQGWGWHHGPQGTGGLQVQRWGGAVQQPPSLTRAQQNNNNKKRLWSWKYWQGGGCPGRGTAGWSIRTGGVKAVWGLAPGDPSQAGPGEAMPAAARGRHGRSEDLAGHAVAGHASL